MSRIHLSNDDGDNGERSSSSSSSYLSTSSLRLFESSAFGSTSKSSSSSSMKHVTPTELPSPFTDRFVNSLSNYYSDESFESSSNNNGGSISTLFYETSAADVDLRSSSSSSSMWSSFSSSITSATPPISSSSFLSSSNSASPTFFGSSLPSSSSSFYSQLNQQQTNLPSTLTLMMTNTTMSSIWETITMNNNNFNNYNDNNNNNTLIDMMTDTTTGNYSLDLLDEEQMERNIYIMPLYQQILWSIIFGTMVFVAAGGNIIVIWIVLTNKRMRTVTNYFLVNLSVADIMVSTLNVIFNFIYMLNSNWPFGELFCKITNFIAILSVGASVFTLMAISIDRYLAIVHPLRPRMSRTATVIIIVIIWIASSFLSLPNIICSKTIVEEFKNGDSREIQQKSIFTFDLHIYNVIILLVTYMLPIASMSYTYFRVGRELWGSQSIGECTAKQMESIKSKRKVCWAPYHIYFLLAHHYPQIINSKYVQHTYLTIYWLAMSNSVYNPFVYCWMNSRFRQGFRNIFCCTCFQDNVKPGERFHHYNNRHRHHNNNQDSNILQDRYHGTARYSCASEACITDTRVRFNGNGNITLQPTTVMDMTTTIMDGSCSPNLHGCLLSSNNANVLVDNSCISGGIGTAATITTTTMTTSYTNNNNNNSNSPLHQQSNIQYSSREML
ncbi:Substance-K receptor [Dermatophagoides pteronyssinus]|uniref:Substance-K receptor n=1 Tax=Dermatophagoides pteronyssinus TaxID=6956 RepID=A0ABQ8JTK7_DERPT|nr:Substance-K receptor [Dermatophagoides pteronyssinus]